eukprot:12608400-Alexandrium_andersonii.AAC.1
MPRACRGVSWSPLRAFPGSPAARWTRRPSLPTSCGSRARRRRVMGGPYVAKVFAEAPASDPDV